LLIAFLISTNNTKAHEDENKLKLLGELLTDQRILPESPNDTAWNENGIDLKIGEFVAGYAKFYGNVWLRNLQTTENLRHW